MAFISDIKLGGFVSLSPNILVIKHLSGAFASEICVFHVCANLVSSVSVRQIVRRCNSFSVYSL